MRRLITLALAGLFLAGAALAQETEVERRKADLDTAYAAAVRDYNEATAAYVAALEPRFVPVAVPVAVPVVQASAAPEHEERMGFAWTHLNDGGCDVAANTLTGSYTREAAVYDVYGMVRTGPSGGDCRRNASAFTIAVERRYAIGGGFSAVAKFGADRRSTAAAYALVDSAGEVLARPDGMASDPVTLPAGSMETVGGYLGVTTPEFAGLRLTGAFNVVPVDWVKDGMVESGYAGHVAAAYEVGSGFDLSAQADFALADFAHWYGGTRASWRPNVPGRLGLEVSADYSFGLTAVDGGEPMEQTFAGLPVVLQGAPRDTAFSVSIGVAF